jgi:hypothetical protein
MQKVGPADQSSLSLKKQISGSEFVRTEVRNPLSIAGRFIVMPALTLVGYGISEARSPVDPASLAHSGTEVDPIHLAALENKQESQRAHSESHRDTAVPEQHFGQR